MIQKIRNLDPVYYVLYCIFIVFLKYVYFVFVNPALTLTLTPSLEPGAEQHHTQCESHTNQRNVRRIHDARAKSRVYCGALQNTTRIGTST